MKKFSLLLMILALGFASCKKEETPEVKGCTDSNAKNYNAEATADDGTCTYEIKGCLDAMAQNYNSEATEDDGSCEYLTASTNQTRKVVLEDFTGVRCGYCPDGHKRAEALKAAHPGEVIIMAMHASYYGTPYGSDPNLVTAFSQPLVVQSKLAGYPAGTVNRYQFNAKKSAAPYFAQNDNSLALSRGGWAAAGEYIMTLSTPVNVGVKTSYNEATGEITVTAEIYYTESTGASTQLNVAVLENDIVVQQIDYSLPPPNVVPYSQQNVLRDMLTGQWGEALPTAEAGTRVQKTYTYKVKAGEVVDNMDVVAFVSEDHQNIYTGARTSVK